MTVKLAPLGFVRHWPEYEEGLTSSSSKMSLISERFVCIRE